MDHGYMDHGRMERGPFTFLQPRSHASTLPCYHASMLPCFNAFMSLLISAESKLSPHLSQKKNLMVGGKGRELTSLIPKGKPHHSTFHATQGIFFCSLLPLKASFRIAPRKKKPYGWRKGPGINFVDSKGEASPLHIPCYARNIFFTPRFGLKASFHLASRKKKILSRSERIVEW